MQTPYPKSPSIYTQIPPKVACWCANDSHSESQRSELGEWRTDILYIHNYTHVQYIHVTHVYTRVSHSKPRTINHNLFHTTMPPSSLGIHRLQPLNDAWASIIGSGCQELSLYPNWSFHSVTCQCFVATIYMVLPWVLVYFNCI